MPSATSRRISPTICSSTLQGRAITRSRFSSSTFRTNWTTNSGMALRSATYCCRLTPTQIASDRQTFVFTSRTPTEDTYFGHGALLEHEVGHHLGFSHSFAGYQCVTDTCLPGQFIPYYANGFNFFSRI